MTAPRYPDAKWRPLGEQKQRPLARHDLIILHTMVMSLWDCDAYFHRDGFTGTESHFGVGHDGETLQWQDLDFSADANLEAWDRAISIETADRGEGFPAWDPNDGSAVPAWTDAQVDRLAHLVAWLCATFGIPCEIAPDALPHRRGIAWHRKGVESSPPYQDGYRVPGGERWSTSTGKVCPGWRRIAQIPEVTRRAQQLLAGNPPAEGDDMPTLDEVKDAIKNGQRGEVVYLPPLAPGQSRTYPLPMRTGQSKVGDARWIVFAFGNAEWQEAAEITGKIRHLDGTIEGLWEGAAEDGTRIDKWAAVINPLDQTGWVSLPATAEVVQVTNTSAFELQPMLEIGPLY